MQKASSLFVTVSLVALLVASIECANTIPGIQTAGGIMAASVDGVSRYLARDGPIQPAITAISGLPLRGGELINRGISSVSDTMSSGAQSMSRRSGNGGTIQMPGMQTIRNNMPSPISSMGNAISSGISYKNSAIMNQAKRGIEAGNRMASMMSGSVKSIGPHRNHSRRHEDKRERQRDQTDDSTDEQDSENQDEQQQDERQDNRRRRNPFNRQENQRDQEQGESQDDKDFSKKGQGFRPELVLDDTDEESNSDEDGPSVKAPGGRQMNQQQQRNPFDNNQQQNGGQQRGQGFNGNQGMNGGGQDGRQGGFNQQRDDQQQQQQQGGGGRQGGRQGGRRQGGRRQGGRQQQGQQNGQQGFNQQGDDQQQQQQQQFGGRGGRRDFQDQQEGGNSNQFGNHPNMY